METKTIFELLSRKPDFVALLILFFLISVALTSISPINYNDEICDWDSLGRVRKLTPEQVRSQPGYEQLSDEEVAQKIEALYQLSLLSYNYHKNKSDGGFSIEY